MTRANGEYVKIYLYLHRCFAQPSADFSLSGLADHFDCTERDILRALKYWEKLRLFRLEYDANDNLSGIRMLNSAYSAAQVNDTADLAQQEKKYLLPLSYPTGRIFQHLIRKSIPPRSRVLPPKTSQIILFTGEVVQAGQPLGTAGETGRSTGAHLHFELLEQGVRYDAGALLGLP